MTSRCGTLWWIPLQ